MTHKVKKGETLTKIARMYNVTVEAIVASNGIKNPDLIKVGQLLQIPVNNNQVYNALVSCLDAIEDLPEYKTLMELVGGRE